MTDQDNQDLTPVNPITFGILAVSHLVFFLRSPSVFLASFLIPSANLLANFGKIPLHHLNLCAMHKLDLGPSSGCNFIALIIDPYAAMRARWLNLSYTVNVWDDSQVASEFERGMTLLDRVHDAGHLMTIMGNRASLIEAEIDKLKTEGDPKQLIIAQQQVVELQVDNAKMRSELEELARRSDQADKELNELLVDLADSQC
ncbi:hypothetical protein BHE74_00040466 [Ensete ventricosum]|nr:hypothetical protein BHE74_00040466 [Ensete ventricosum]